MRTFRPIHCLVLLSALTPLAATVATAAELKGAAILDHACGKTSVQQMALVHAGKMEESLKLSTPEMQAQWKAMPAEDRTMMAGMMKEMSQNDADYKAAIQAGGILVVDGASATLTIKKEHKDANGSSTETMTQKYVIDAKGCWITH
jgi:Spy/CpxP family protein refolding chaperone